MSPPLLPILLHGKGGVNPPKISMLLSELSLPYTFAPTLMADVKTPSYLSINPNGRLPAIYDPNTGVTLWESGAIMEYLVEVYDGEKRMSFEGGTKEAWWARQWLFFQASGQGPYFGQAAWFEKFHHEQLPSAKERYNKEVNRVTSVLSTHLTQQALLHTTTTGPWLVGNKFTYADLSFIPWQQATAMILAKEDYDVDKYPVVKEWIAKMLARKEAGGAWAEAMATMAAEQAAKAEVAKEAEGEKAEEK